MVSRRCAFTLIELVVVVAIIGTLCVLLLPAVQAARESGRKSECQNHLRQIATALHSHIAAKDKLPSGGWGHWWTGVPGRGSGDRQPGGWIYSTLPYLEEVDVHSLGGKSTGPEAEQAYSKRLSTPLPMFVCPTRRICTAWPLAPSHPGRFRPYGQPHRMARSDYAINGGSSQAGTSAGPETLEQGDSILYWRERLFPDEVSGVCHLRLGVSIESIVDGTSNTYLGGEKMIPPECYENGLSEGDNDGMYIGYSNDLHRFAGNFPGGLMPPMLDGPENVFPRGYFRFGSAHAAGFYMAFCDGSVRLIDYDIDGQVHFRAGHRKDGGAPIEGI
jgi:prepilin-type N-terminal cleavage/methylation domain-containing protein